jgi:hypothetical protein
MQAPLEIPTLTLTLTLYLPESNCQGSPGPGRGPARIGETEAGLLEVEFDRPLDHGLLARCLHVAGPDGQPVAGGAEPGPGERSWRLTPDQLWTPGGHRLIVDPVLEDLAGNSVSRVFDRDLARPEDRPGPDQPVAVAFCAR